MEIVITSHCRFAEQAVVCALILTCIGPSLLFATNVSCIIFLNWNQTPLHHNSVWNLNNLSLPLHATIIYSHFAKSFYSILKMC